jgi:hypothetical protein
MCCFKIEIVSARTGSFVATIPCEFAIGPAVAFSSFAFSCRIQTLVAVVAACNQGMHGSHEAGRRGALCLAEFEDFAGERLLVVVV